MLNTFKKIGLSLLVASTLYGATPVTINFQGFLKDGDGNAVTGDKSIEFNLYTVATDGASIWSSTKTITVTDGVYSTVLGADEDMSGLAFDTQYYIGINIADDGEMTPRQPLTSTAYALKAKQLDVAYTLPTTDGSNGQILTTNGSGAATWQTPVTIAARAYATSITTVGDTITQITFGGESYDTGNNFASNAFTAPSDGYYQVNSCVELPAEQMQFQLAIYVADNVYSLGTQFESSTFGRDLTNTCVSDLVPLSSGDTVKIYGIADSAQDNSTGSTKSFVSIIKLGN